jgi:predicted NACHT family NTPase
MALTLVDHKKRRQTSKSPYTLPFLLFLREYVDTLKESPTFSLADAVQAQVSKWGRPAPVGWIERCLTRGRCLILLDGLDEVANLETRRQMVRWVEHQMVAYGDNRFIVTSHPFDYRSNPLSGVTVLEVHAFTPEPIEHFVHNWYLANEIMSSQRNDPGAHLKAKEGAEDLLRRLRNTPVLFALAVNPLLLTMIATAHRYRGSLPGTRVALYAEICEVFLGKRQEARGLIVELSPTQKVQVLQPLAYQMMREGIKEIAHTKAQEIIAESLKLVNQQIPPAIFLQLVENASGLLLEREQGIYSFAHLTFQEYLAAMYIRENKLENTLIAQVGASWWHETIRLYCAQADATPIIAACLAGNRPSVVALTLALECQKEARKVQPVVKAQLNDLLNQGIEDADPDMRRIVAETLLTRRFREMVHLKDDIYRDTSFITCAEYQVFLDEQRARWRVLPARPLDRYPIFTRPATIPR